jgi:hypothetical protein
MNSKVNKKKRFIMDTNNIITDFFFNFDLLNKATYEYIYYNYYEQGIKLLQPCDYPDKNKIKIEDYINILCPEESKRTIPSMHKFLMLCSY